MVSTITFPQLMFGLIFLLSDIYYPLNGMKPKSIFYLQPLLLHTSFLILTSPPFNQLPQRCILRDILKPSTLSLSLKMYFLWICLLYHYLSSGPQNILLGHFQNSPPDLSLIHLSLCYQIASKQIILCFKTLNFHCLSGKLQIPWNSI